MLLRLADPERVLSVFEPTPPEDVSPCYYTMQSQHNYKKANKTIGPEPHSKYGITLKPSMLK